MRKGEVYVNRIPAGILTETDEGKYIFEYFPSYRMQTNTPVCLAMPVREVPYEATTLFPFFSNMLSEGSNREFKARINGVAPHDDFGLLLATANYDTIGAVTVLPV